MTTKGIFVRIIIRSVLFLAILGLTQTSAYAQKAKAAKVDSAKIKAGEDSKTEQDEGEILIDIKAGAKNSIFKARTPVNYSVNLKSTYKLAQAGKFSYVVSTADGEKVYEDSLQINIGRGGSRSVNVRIPGRTAGFYQLSLRMNLTAYDDTVKKVFGVDINNILSKPVKPADFDAFWKKTRSMLAAVAPQYKITPRKELGTKEIDVYLIEMHSWGNAVIRGWLTVPKHRTKMLPIRYRVPGYLVPMEPSFTEDDFAVFQINVRGNGNSKDAINTQGKQYNLFNIEDRDSYVYRAAYMDCIRGLDFLCTEGAKTFKLDTNRVSIDGGSQGGCLAIVVAGMDKRIKLVTTEVPLYSDMRQASRITRMVPPKGQTPVWLLNNYVDTHRGFSQERLFKVWDYYDPINFAPMVKVPVLMGIGLMDDLCPPSCSLAVYNRIGNNQKEIWISADKAHEVDAIYYRFQYVWLREHLLIP